MKPVDRKPFLEIVMGFAELKGKQLSAPALELYWNAMQDWNLADFKAAAEQLLKTCEFMPTPKHFEDLRKAGKETAGEVFASIRQWLQYTPNGYTVKQETPHAIAASIRAMGGPNAYAMCEEDKLPFLERRFCEHYDQIAGVEEIRDRLPQIAQSQNRLRLSCDGNVASPPVGDRDG
jgi:hypothetical protein